MFNADSYNITEHKEKVRNKTDGTKERRVMNKEEFKKRWESDANGGGSTFDDVADCAKQWGLYAKPRTHDINEVLEAVLKAANIKEKQKEQKQIMAQKVLILGDSGTGKSASLRNFKPEEVAVINCAGKPLPFKNHFKQVTPSYENLTDDIFEAMVNAAADGYKVIVIDDAQYIMSFQYMRRIKENGWDKWNDIQGDFFNIIRGCDNLPSDIVVYFLSHLQRDDEGHEKIKTMGKMLDEKITIEGLFTTVLKTNVSDGKYCFLTQNSGLDTVKSPIGMFETYAIDNDLKYVDTKIRNYYEIGEYVSDAEVEKLDAVAAVPEVEKPDADGKKRRTRKVRTAAEAEPETVKPDDEEKPKRRRARKSLTEEINSDDIPF